MSGHRDITRRRRLRQGGSSLLVSRVAQYLDQKPDVETHLDPAELPAWRDHYRELRSAGRELCSKLAASLDRQAVDFGGESLAMMRGGVLVLTVEHEVGVMMDHAIYHFRRNGRNAIDRLLADEPPPPGSLQEEWLHAAQRAYHSIFLIMEVLDGFGAVMRDVMTGREVLLADVNFSRTAREGGSMAARLLPFEHFAMTSGAALPIVNMETLTRIGSYIQRTLGQVQDPRTLSAPQRLLLEAFIIRTCLEEGSSERIRYAESM